MEATADFEVLQATVKRQRLLIGSFFERLICCNAIREYCIGEFKVNVEERSYTFHFQTHVGKGREHVVDLFFCVRTDDLAGRIKLASTSRQANFFLPALFNNDNLFYMMENQLKKWNHGQTNEDHFEHFAKSLIKKYPIKVLTVQKTPESDDMHHGVDFVVTFVMRSNLELKHIKFNVKSSHVYLARHKARHPKVSTFLFTIDHLEDPKALRKRFFKFLISSQNETVHL